MTCLRNTISLIITFLVLFLCSAMPAFAVSGTVTFTSSAGFSGSTVTDGQGGSADIADITLQIISGDGFSWTYETPYTQSAIAASYGNSASSSLITIKSSSQATNFSFSSFFVSDYGGGLITVTGYDNGAPKGSVNLDTTANGWENTFTQANGLTSSIFQNVDEIRITPQIPGNMWIAINNIVIADAVVPNVAPTVTSLSGDSVSYAEGSSATLLDQGSNATASEDVSWSGGKLQVAIPTNKDLVADLFRIRNQGTGAGEIGVTGSNVTYGGTVIGTVGGGQGILPLTVTFNASATDAAVTALLRNITFQTTNNSKPSTATRTVRITLSDSVGNTSSNNDVSVIVTAVNDAPTFSTGQGNTITMTTPGVELGYAAAVQPDGKILVAGNSANLIDPDTWTYDENHLLLARYNANGSLDTSFGTGGFARINLWNSETGYETGIAIAVLPDGKIVVGAGEPTTSNSEPKFGVVRFNADGSADTGFGTNGGASFTVGTENAATVHGMAMDAKGNILLVGESQWRSGSVYQYTTVLRVKPDGTLDATFSGDGIATTNVGGGTDYNYAAGIAVQPDGKIVVVGTRAGAYLLSALRYNDDGTLDTSFGTSGIAQFDVAASYDGGSAVAIQPDGKIVVGGNGYNGVNNDFMVLRLNSNGTLDTGFDGDGKLILDLAGDDQVRDVAILSDGKILVSGQSSSQPAFVRLNSNGSPDTAFDSDGILVVIGGETGEAAVLQGDGRIVAVGSHPDVTWTYYDLAIARYTADGDMDISFVVANTLDGTPTFTQGDLPVALDEDVAVFDAELSGGSHAGATLSLARNGGASANDIFSAVDSGTLDPLTQGGNLAVDGTTIGTVTTNSGGTLLLTFTANATENLIASAMRQIAYSNSIGSPPSVQINWTFSDGNSGSQGAGGAQSATGQTTVSVISSNPVVSSVTVPANGTYIVGQNLDFTVNFDKAVTVTTTGGTPYLPITLNTGGTVNAFYQSGSGTTTLVFRYTIQIGNLDGDGIAVGAAISLNSGTIRDFGGNDANLTLNSVGSTASVLVDGIAPTVSSVAAPPSATYVVGQNLNFTVNFSENVTVNTAGGTPYLGVTVGSSSVPAAYVSGSGSSALQFRYTVQTGDLDTDGIVPGANVTANGGTIRDAGGNDATLTLNSVGSTTGVLVDAVAPTVASVSVPGNGTYVAGQNLDFTVNFSENVVVNTAGGTPYLSLTLNTGGVVQASYLSGSSSSSLVFRYSVGSGTQDSDGVTVGALSLNGGTIRDGVSNGATLTLNSVGSTVAVLVSDAVPVVTAATNLRQTSFTANWDVFDGMTGYRLDVAKDTGFTDLVAGFNDKDMGSSTSASLTGLLPNTPYFYRVRGYNDAGTTVSSLYVEATTLLVVSSLAYDSETTTLYAGLDGAGVFRSSDKGLSWVPATSQPGNLRVMALAIHPTTGATLYAATNGGGVFVSTDGGDSWSACANTGLGSTAALSLVMTSAGTLYAGTEAGVFSSTDCSSWTARNNGLPDSAGSPPKVLAVDQADSQKLVAGCPGSGIYLSTTGGASWTAASGQPGNSQFTAIAVTPGNSSRLYAATDGGGVYYSGDGGSSWNPCDSTSLTNLHVLSLTVNSAGRIHAGTEDGVFSSTDGCSTWSAMNSGVLQ